MQSSGCEVLCQAVAQLRGRRELSPSPRLQHRDGHQEISVLQQEGKALQQQCACRGTAGHERSRDAFAQQPLCPHSTAGTGLNFAEDIHAALSNPSFPM